MNDRHLELLEGVLHGSRTLDDCATRTGLPVEELRRQVDVLAMARALRRRERRRWARLVMFATGLAAASVVWVARPALAQAMCTPTLPSPLTTFCADQPAQAQQVNGNFLQVTSWLSTKTGPLTQGYVTSSQLISTGNVRGNAVDASSGWAMTWNASGSIGETDFVNYRGLGVGGFRFYNSANTSGLGTNVATIDASGNIFAGAALYANGPVVSNGFALSCTAGSSGYHYPFCCRINIRNGQTSCRVTTASTFPSWTAVPDAFAAGGDSHYSLSCGMHVAGVNYPYCCRTDHNGSTSCVYSSTATLSSWSAAAAPF